jgi:hypothetical protein
MNTTVAFGSVTADTLTFEANDGLQNGINKLRADIPAEPTQGVLRWDVSMFAQTFASPFISNQPRTVQVDPEFLDEATYGLERGLQSLAVDLAAQGRDLDHKQVQITVTVKDAR